jgi:hypothetical protein
MIIHPFSSLSCFQSLAESELELSPISQPIKYFVYSRVKALKLWCKGGGGKFELYAGLLGT